MLSLIFGQIEREARRNLLTRRAKRVKTTLVSLRQRIFIKDPQPIWTLFISHVSPGGKKQYDQIFDESHCIFHAKHAYYARFSRFYRNISLKLPVCRFSTNSSGLK